MMIKNEYENTSLSISESYLVSRREPLKNQLLGDAIEYLLNFIDLSFSIPKTNYHWTKKTRYCYKIECNCNKCNLIEDKINCKIKEDVKKLYENNITDTKEKKKGRRYDITKIN